MMKVVYANWDGVTKKLKDSIFEWWLDEANEIMNWGGLVKVEICREFEIERWGDGNELVGV